MSELVAVKTAELSGAALDWAVAIAVEYGPPMLIESISDKGEKFYSIGLPNPLKLAGYSAWKPSTDWSQGGPLIEKYAPTLTPFSMSFGGTQDYWVAQSWDERALPIDGPTPLIAACRAIVASVLGDTVSVPKELV